ncbi:MAG: hypothetical protein II374_06030 [Lachnospiraceae bacterium]|nr:hypothetical protein [Lachnospiraceae bacterium]
MKEQLYTIPVNDAFETDCECPLCLMHSQLEKDAIDFTLGPSYMEDDIRMETDKIGFCSHHMKQMYKNQNRLGVALMLHTHMKKTISTIEKMSKSSSPAKKSLFSKKESSDIQKYTEDLSHSCFICNRIDGVFKRYIATIIHCYKHDSDFPAKFEKSKGFCTTHYGMLYDAAGSLGSSDQQKFIEALNNIYLTNMKRVADDLEWFIDKFDYRNEDKPWKNSKDAIPRSIIKTNSYFEE